MKKIASIALSLTILAGGIASAVPANASQVSSVNSQAVNKASSTDSTKLKNIDNQIKAKKERVRTAELGLTTNKSAGNSYDVKSRTAYFNALRNTKQVDSLSCERYASDLTRDILTKSKVKTNKSYVNALNNLNKESTVRHSNISKYKKAAYADRNTMKANFYKGVAFQHQYGTLLKFQVERDTERLNCANARLVEIKKQNSKLSKVLTAEDRKHLAKRVSDMVEKYQKEKDRYNKMIAPSIKRVKASHDTQINLEVKKLKSDIVKLELQKKNLLKK